MQKSKKEKLFIILMLAITIAVLVVCLFARAKYSKKYKGSKVYLDDVIKKEKYELYFKAEHEVNENVDYICIYIYVYNSTQSEQTYTFSNIYYIKEGKEVDFGIVDDNKLVLEPDHEGYYWIPCQTDSKGNIDKVHFGLNGDYYNLYPSNRNE